MGNYSYFLQALNAASELDWDAFDMSLLNHDPPWMPETLDELKVIKTMADLGRDWHDKKLIGYLSNDSIRFLQGIARIIKDKDTLPRLYYEEEGWDRLAYLEFHPKSGDVMLATKTFTYPAWEDEENDPDEAWDAIRETSKTAALHDPAGWNSHKLSSTRVTNKALDDFHGLLGIMGIRSEDIVANPSKYPQLVAAMRAAMAGKSPLDS